MFRLKGLQWAVWNLTGKLLLTNDSGQKLILFNVFISDQETALASLWMAVSNRESRYAAQQSYAKAVCRLDEPAERNLRGKKLHLR